MSEYAALMVAAYSALILSYTCLIMALPCRYSLRFTVVVLALLSFAVFLFSRLTGLMSVVPPGLIGILYIPVLIWLFKGMLFQKVFAVFFQLMLAAFQARLVEAVVSLFIPEQNERFNLTFLICTLVLYSIYAFLVYRYGRRFFESLYVHGQQWEWALYSLGIMFSFAFMMTFMLTLSNPLLRIVILLFSLWSLFMLCYAIINTHEKSRKKYEADLAHKEKLLLESLNRTKSEFYGNISHEMKTPLTIIATDIQLAEQFVNDGNLENAKELMREAWQETMQTANLVTDALAFSRGQETAKPMERIDYGEVVKTTLAVTLPLIKKQGNKLEQDIMKLPQIRGNTDMLAGALVNLLSNANRYTENGVISVRWVIENERCCLTVRDNGTGIPPEILPRVFERGVTDGSGTGLGLAIVKSVMELHGGDVSIESELGKGTAVTLIFPPITEETA